MRDKPENIRRKSIRQAVEEALGKYDFGESTITFCGTAVAVDNYYVVPILLVSEAALNRLPRLPKPILYSEWSSSLSIIDCLLHKILDEASEGLEKREPGRFIRDPNERSVEELLKQAAREFCSVITMAVEDFMLQGVFSALNKVSSIPYEGAAPKGTIVFAAVDAQGLDFQVRFPEPLSLYSSKLVRKLLEMTDDRIACVCDSEEGISGLAFVDENDSLFRVAFTGHYCWSLFYGQAVLMESSFGVPKVPKPRIKKSSFVSNIRRVLGNITEQQADKIWGIVTAVIEQKHGTMLVVSDDALKESQRLQSQSIVVDPVSLTSELMLNISSIDGAILLDSDCVCHAVGVILDGMVSEEGDASRGARFNSAIKYIGSINIPTLCLVVSEDGYVNMIPNLKPQIERDLVERKVNLLVGLNADNYHKTRSWLDRNRFYLTEKQCDIVNAQLERIQAEAPPKSVMLSIPEFVPDNEMNESYYTDFFEKAR